MNVRLVPSERMNMRSGVEDEYIRIPKRARLHFNSKGDKLVLSLKNTNIVLKIRAAYKDDVAKLTGMVRGGKTSEEEASMTGFVTAATLAKLTGNASSAPKYCYLSDGIEDIKVGADPEFCLVDPATMKFKYAEHIQGLTKTAVLGHDGPLAEVRPPPENDPAELVKNIERILKKESKLVDPFLWRGGASYKSPNHQQGERIVHIGGHLQFGNPELMPKESINAIYRQTVRVLDELVALPLVRIDTPNPSHRRNEMWNSYGKYGRHGDHKAKENRFEWRVPSGLWLTHPDLARAVIGTSKAIVEACYQSMAENKFSDNWICGRMDRKSFLSSWGVLPSQTVGKIINDATPDGVDPSLLNRTIKKLREISTYSKYKTEIEEFIKLVRLSEKDRDSINLDLKDTWLNKGKLIK